MPFLAAKFARKIELSKAAYFGWLRGNALFSGYAIVGTYSLGLVRCDYVTTDKTAFTENLMNERIKNPGVYFKISD